MNKVCESHRVNRVIIDLGTWLTEEFKEKVITYQLPFLQKELEKNNTLIILSGGHTNLLFPFVSEALLKLKFLAFEGITTDKIFLEDESIRTTQNIKFSLKLLSSLGIRVQKIIFTGEKSSEREVKFLAPRYSKRILGYKPEIDFFGIPYLEEKRRKEKEKKFVLILIAYYFPPLDFILSLLRWLSIRKKCFKVRHILCTFPFSWSCKGCKLKEVLIQKVIGK